MRSTGEPEWHEHRARVPLTGREPLLGQLKRWLRTNGPGGGWLSLTGPSGAGVSRMLDEVESLDAEERGAAPLRLRPAREDRRPMAALRRGLHGLLGARRGPRLIRILGRLHPGSADEVRVLANWLDDDWPPKGQRPRGAGPGRALVRTLLERLVPSGPILVDDLQHIDEATLAVLSPSAHGEGPSVLAGSTGAAPEVPGGLTWTLEPLGLTQVELLLRRWLRQPATARRLASVLTEGCHGWPGRLVEAVRTLGRSGHLTRRDRGIVVVEAPASWPDGLRRTDTFRQWVKAQGAQARRVLDLAAVEAEPHDIGRLADAAGVKRRFVEGMLAEAIAARGGHEPGRFFVSRARRRSWLDALPATRRDDATRRLAEVSADAGAEVPTSSCFDALAAEATQATAAGDRVAARTAWHKAARLPDGLPPVQRARWHRGLARLAHARGAIRLADAHRARAGRLFLGAGDLVAAASLLGALGESAVRRGYPHRALGPLGRAAEIHALHGDREREAEIRFRRGRVLGWLDDYGRATEELERALRAAEAADRSTLLPRIHRALAGAWRGCGDLARERAHAEMAAGLATTALGRVQAAAVVARVDLRAGVPGAEDVLARCEGDLRTAGFIDEADRARAALADARLRAGDPDRAEAILTPGPAHAVERLAAARVDLAVGRTGQACATLELLGADMSLPADLRATCYARLAEALRVEGSLSEARAAAVAAAGLLQVGHRSRANDARLHKVLARVFRGVGEDGRAVRHRSAARRGMRSLIRSASDPRERRRLMRSFWRRDPGPDRQVG